MGSERLLDPGLQRKVTEPSHDAPVALQANRQRFSVLEHVVTYAHYARVADCADAMADAWEDTAGCAQANCLHENLLK